MFLYQYELGKAASILVRDLFKLKSGETFVITADTECDSQLQMLLRLLHLLSVQSLWLSGQPHPQGWGKLLILCCPMLPVEALTAVLKEADAWVEFSNQWLLYSTWLDGKQIMDEGRQIDPDLAKLAQKLGKA